MLGREEAVLGELTQQVQPCFKGAGLAMIRSLSRLVLETPEGARGIPKAVVAT